nr:TonB-dependent receptor [Marinimicrobium alkaliphilum]
MKRSLCLAMLMASQAAWSNEVSGVVRDAQGQPVPNARVEVVGSHVRVNTDAEGRFELQGLAAEGVELHIEAPTFAHRIVHAPVSDGTPLEIRLSRSVLEVIDVRALPWHASKLESARPVDALAGEQLRNRQTSTLGDTLALELGVHSNYYGPVASSPVIRGLEGPRVLITQNGLGAGDASRTGPDHMVATETSTAQQIEILRGPATLLYGSGAIGGVVNVVDDRVPSDNETRGEWQAEYNDVADEKLVSGSLTTGFDRFAFHVDGFLRESNDYKIPVAAEIEDDHDHGHDEQGHGNYRLENSAYEGSGFNLGSSYLLDNGFVGISYGRLERTYGIPGHSHGEGDDHGHDHGHDHGNGQEDEEDVYSDLVQDRWQLHSELTLDNPIFSAVNTRLGYTDYTHKEIEHGQVFTTFDVTSYEGKMDLFHHPIAHWRGALSLQYKYEDYVAEGAEAFTPPSETESIALALVEERHFGDVQIQLGARLERVEVKADQVIVDMGGHGHDHDHGHDHGNEENLLNVYSVKHVFEPFSLSAGAVWDFAYGYNLGVSLSHSQRAPSAAELLSHGAHIGTNAYEVGALFVIHEEGDGDYHYDLNPNVIELETSNNIDISLRKFEGDIGFTLGAFYNQIDDFYYLQETGLTAEAGGDHGHDHGHDHGDEGFPLYIYTARDARLYGFEGEFVWQASEPLKLSVFSDYTRANLRDGGDLPRIPPLRVGGQLNYRLNNLGAELNATHYFEQEKIAALESESEGYTLVNAQLSYYLTAAGQDMTFYVRGSNLLDEEARPHTSFLKDKAPLPGRAFAAGIRATF